MIYKKLVADCDDKLMEKIVKAIQKERRTLANFIRISCEERADRVLGVDKNAN
jgi:hypothetical protein